MDPVSIFSLISGAAGLALQCGQVARSLHDLIDKFKDTDMTMLSAAQELDIIRLAWERIGLVLSKWNESDEADTDLLQRLRRQLEFGNLVMGTLTEDLAALGQKSYIFSRRAKFIWNEQQFKLHHDRIRGQVAAMNLLLSVLQLPSANERKSSLGKGSEVLRKSDESALSIVPSRMSSRLSASIVNSRRESINSTELVYQELSVDDDLFTARVYKRNYRNGTMLFGRNLKLLSAFSDSTGKERDGEKESGRLISPARCVWAARVDFFSAFTISEVTIEGPSTSLFLPGIKSGNLTSSSQYPSVRRLVLAYKSEGLLNIFKSTTLGSTNGRFPEWQQCLLFEACQQGHKSLVKVLLDKKVYLDGHVLSGNATHLSQTTPIHVAARSSNTDLMKMILRKYRHPDVEDFQGNRPMHLASQEGSIPMIETLLEAGASVSVENKMKYTPLHVAAKHVTVDSSVLHYLLSCGVDSNAQTEEGFTALHLASMNERRDKIEDLLAWDRQSLAQNQHSLELEDTRGWRPLHWACRYGRLSSMQTLLKAGAIPYSRTRDGRTPLHIACIRGVLGVVQEILRWEGSLLYIQSGGWAQSPLVVAVSGLNFPIVSRLLTEGVGANYSCNFTGKTVLQQALSTPCYDTISYGHRIKTIAALLEAGADAGKQDLRGNNVFHHWALAGISESKSSGPEYYQELEGNRCEDVVTSLVGHGADVNAKNLRGQTALDLAITGGHSYLVEALRAAGGVLSATASSQAFATPDYYLQYPEPVNESFTQWKAGAIPRHDPPDDDRYTG